MSIFTGFLLSEEVEFRESLRAFFPQGQSKLSVIISFPTKRVGNWSVLIITDELH